jgi:Delta7-sterol 5-desaturase
MITGHPLEAIINGPAHHTLHHLYFTVNYGQVNNIYFFPSFSNQNFNRMMWGTQYFTWADRVGKSYRKPESSLDPLLEVPPNSESTPKEKKEQ